MAVVAAASAGLAVGFTIGLGARESVRRLSPRRNQRAVFEILADESDDLEANFAAHIDVMRGQVSHFADTLAVGDPLLRERLRAFEWGGQP